ncbi:MAG: NAD(P)-dependent oxidoreductase [Beijerinckiaceae bacterium]|nr:NAD(P)-dependent oxidoreductase [Beijerinckiaceae bacterium]
MGLPMARNLVVAGHEVAGFDMRAEATARLAAHGGRAADSAAAALDGADIAILMVVNITQAEDALFTNGAIEGLSPGGVVIVMATCPPAAMAALAGRVEAAGYGFLDAPVSGGVVGAQAGSLTIMAAGRTDIFETAKPVLDRLGKKIFHVGTEAGQGSTAKAVNQLMCGAHIAVAAEAMALAERFGVDRQTMFEIVSGSAASSWMLLDRGPRMLEDEPHVTSAIDIFVKDLGIVVETGEGAQAPLPMARQALDLFRRVSAAGMGSLDDSQLIRAYRAPIATET